MARIELNEADNGSTRTARVGDELVIDLDEIPSSGHRWAPVSTPEVVEGPTEDDFAPVEGGGIGAGGRRTLAFRVREPGEGRLTLVRRQEWDPEHPSGRFEVTVRVPD